MKLFSDKKAQLVGLEIKLFSIGFLVGLAIGIVAIVLLLFFGIMPDIVVNFLCNCG